MAYGMVAEAKAYLRKLCRYVSPHNKKDSLDIIDTNSAVTVFCQKTKHYGSPEAFYLFAVQGDDIIFRKEFGMSDAALEGTPFLCLVPEVVYQDIMSAREKGLHARIFLDVPRPKPQ